MLLVMPSFGEVVDNVAVIVMQNSMCDVVVRCIGTISIGIVLHCVVLACLVYISTHWTKYAQ